ncbi:cobaltochelatase subunit CobN [Prevotella koreensis]
MKKKIIIATVIALLLVLGTVAWNVWLGRTKVAFVNYQAITLGHIAKAIDNPMIKISDVSLDNLDELDDYDIVLITSMGLRLTEEQRERIKEVAGNGTPVLCTMVTNPENDFTNMDSITADTLKQYIGSGGRENYHNMLLYLRKYVDKKLIYAPTPKPVVEHITKLLFHTDPDKKDDEDAQFASVAEYHEFLKKKGIWKDNAPGIIVTGQMGEPKELIEQLEATGNIVYPVNSIRQFIDEKHCDSINVSAVINMAHGRLGDNIVMFLKEKNVPLFSPLNVNRLVEDWENDKMGMSGGFLSQSVVMPEIDGALRSFALFAHYIGDDGLRYVKPIPERLETFVKTVNNYIGLKHKQNKEKRVAIYYYKGPGQNAMTAGGMEVGASLYNLLLKLKSEGYDVSGLPNSALELVNMIQSQGAVFGTYAEGAFNDFMKNGKPELIDKQQYESWIKKTIRPEKYKEVVNAFGEFPGEYMSTPDGKLGIARLRFGNVVLLPQNSAGKGDDSFKIAHGTDAAPPHTYIASYLWVQYGFNADVLIHFGTHGSLEFTPKKQVALGAEDWPDRLVGAIPHFYLYTIGNVGEGLIAKRRSYAGLQSYLTPPFMESQLRGTYKELEDKIKIYNDKVGKNLPGTEKASLDVKALAIKLGIHRDLGLDSVKGKPYSADDIMRIENFAEELAMEKVTGQLYTLGIPYEPARIESSVYAMSTDPIAYSLFALDKLKGRADNGLLKHKPLFTQRYVVPARGMVARLLSNNRPVTDEMLCQMTGISKQELDKAHEIYRSLTEPNSYMGMGMGNGSSSSGMPKGAGMKSGNMPKAMTDAMKSMSKKGSPKGGMPPAMMKAMGSSGKMKGQMPMGMMDKKQEQKSYSKQDKEFSYAIMEVERTIKNVGTYKKNLLESPIIELESIINAMNGGYTMPSPGGDPIANPNTIPTGRNLFGINAEATPSEMAWEKGKELAENTIEMYRKRHNDSIPRKVSYTLWSGEFVETEGATIAQILYMLGVEPIRDAFGRVSDIKLIPSKELGRPRIDVVVQTSGQLRDLAASRLFLINRAVEMAAEAKDDKYENQVSEGLKESERLLIDKGVSPKEARQFASRRVFGGVNGNYGTGIQAMVMSSDRWDKRSEVADTYINNMGAFYGDADNWESFKQYAFEAALTRTDVVIQPRQSNTWGALSLDHVYEFMGGLNLAVNQVTGKDPDAYLSDYRNHNNMRMQEVKEAIGVESRSTIFNPFYIKEKMKGGASAAGGFAEIVQNTYGWEVMKPNAIDNEFWDELYDVYINDKHNLGVKDFFEQKNPAAIEEITAVMLESARKGMWKAGNEKVRALSQLHIELVNKHKPSCSGFVCDNVKLRDFIAENSSDKTSSKLYKDNIEKIREGQVNEKQGMKMKKETLGDDADNDKSVLSNVVVSVVAVVVILALVLIVRRSRRQRETEDNHK